MVAFPEERAGYRSRCTKYNFLVLWQLCQQKFRMHPKLRAFEFIIFYSTCNKICTVYLCNTISCLFYPIALLVLVILTINKQILGREEVRKYGHTIKS